MKYEVLIPAREVLDRHLERGMAMHNSAAFRHLERVTEQFNNPLYQAAIREYERRTSDPTYWLMQQASEDAAVRRKERGFWVYRKTMGIISGDKIRKALIRLLVKLLTLLSNPNSFASRVRAALRKQGNSDSIVKVHSPPIRLIPKSLHPVDSAA